MSMPIDIIEPIQRDEGHALHIVDEGDRIVLAVWRDGAPLRRFRLAVRRSELGRVLEALTLAYGHQDGR